MSTVSYASRHGRNTEVRKLEYGAHLSPAQKYFHFQHDGPLYLEIYFGSGTIWAMFVLPYLTLARTGQLGHAKRTGGGGFAPF